MHDENVYYISDGDDGWDNDPNLANDEPGNTLSESPLQSLVFGAIQTLYVDSEKDQIVANLCLGDS